MARVDIAIPCYQYGRFLPQCVASIQKQEVEDLRILIIDNASTDNSVEVARELALQDRRIEVIVHAKNLGSHASYNEAIDWAISEYFLLLDADDLLAPGALLRALTLMDERTDVSFTHGRIAYAKPDGSLEQKIASDTGSETWDVVPGHEFISGFCRFIGNMASAPSVIRRTGAQKAAGYYRPGLPYTDDVELWLRLAMLGSVARTNAIQAYRRLHSQQATTKFRNDPVRDFVEHEAAVKSFFSNEGKALPDHAELAEIARRSMESHAYWSAVSHYIRGYRAAARPLMQFANRNARLGVKFPPLRPFLEHGRGFSRMVQVLSEATFRQLERPGSRERDA